MALTPARIEELGRVAREAARAGRGEKQAVYERACAQLGVSLATLHRQLSMVTVRAQRKRRVDAGCFTLPLNEAQLIATYVMEHYRGNGKRGISVRTALKDLRANRLVKAEATDPATGEVTRLSESAVVRALKGYGLHWDQVRTMALAVAQSSPHPNHTWQLDASVCTLVYMDDDGTTDMPAHVFYKNKPENFERIERKRLTRFVITDHTSGAIKLRYYLGGESVANFSEFFLWAIAKRPGYSDPMHGVPFQLMVDPGSGMAGAFKNLVRRLAIKLIVNAPGNPRAKGQVENAQNIVEMDFEHQFRGHRPASITEINARAEIWSANYNATAVHSRHGMTRFMKWMEITPQQLRIAPSLEICRELLTADVKACTVDVYGRVQFGGGNRRWDVRSLPGGVQMGEKIDITYNAYNDQEVYAVYHDAQGMEVLHACPLVTTDEHGFQSGAREIGAGYQALHDTAADRARKHADLLATGATTEKDAKKVRKAKGFEVFKGAVRFDHLKTELDAQVPFIPKAGEQLPATTASSPAAVRNLTLFEAGQWLTANGTAMARDVYDKLRAWYPEGVPEDELQALKDRLTVRAGLRVVAGGGGAQ